MAEVLFASAGFAEYDGGQTLPARFERLVDDMAQSMKLADTVKDKWVAIKMHVGRGIGYTTVHPLFVRALVAKVKSYGGKPYITDQTIQDAHLRGYTEQVVGCPIVEVCGVAGRYYYEHTVGFNNFTHVDIAGHIQDADVMIDFSHVKGHGACGYGGACKNIAMGCVTDRTRQELHRLEGGISWDADLCTHCESCIRNCNHNANSFKDGQYDVFFHQCTFCGHCVKVCPTAAITLDEDHYEDFQTGMALCTKTVLDGFAPGHVYYINFMTQITAVCDCWGLSTPALVPDIGVVASQDIVAVEQACLDMIKVEDLLPNGVPQGYDLGTAGHLFERLHHKDPFIQLKKLEGYGLGSPQYTLRQVK